MSFEKPDISTGRLILTLGLLAVIAIFIANGVQKYPKSSNSVVRTTKK
jgi:hypothetical protein